MGVSAAPGLIAHQSGQRIGIYGGAFDPPHLTHVAIAQAALDQLGLSPAAHRLAMAQLAFEPLPRTVVDSREIERSGPTYTVDTLRELTREFAGAELVLLMGADQAAALHTWHEYDEVLRLATISVAERAPAPGEISEKWPADPPSVPEKARIVRLELPATDASATRIRGLIAAGEGIAPLVPAAVARYIERHHLYLPD